jgi:hypothetical protein
MSFFENEHQLELFSLFKTTAENIPLSTLLFLSVSKSLGL